MSRTDTVTRILVVATMLATISVFTRATPLTLITLALGGAMIVLSSLYSYRPGGLMGVIVAAVGAASAVRLDSLLEVGTVLTAILGLLLPLFVLALHALGTEQEGVRIMSIRKRPVLIALAFGFTCILSAPLIIGFMSLTLPSMTTRLSGTWETAMILLIATVGGVLLTRRTSARSTIGPAEEDADRKLT